MVTCELNEGNCCRLYLYTSPEYFHEINTLLNFYSLNLDSLVTTNTSALDEADLNASTDQSLSVKLSEDSQPMRLILPPGWQQCEGMTVLNAV